MKCITVTALQTFAMIDDKDKLMILMVILFNFVNFAVVLMHTLFIDCFLKNLSIVSVS